MCVLLSPFAHETAGAARTRSFARPLLLRGARALSSRANEFSELGRNVSRECGSVFANNVVCDESEQRTRRPGLRAGTHTARSRVFGRVADTVGTNQRQGLWIPGVRRDDNVIWRSPVPINVMARSACDDLSAVAAWRGRKQSSPSFVVLDCFAVARNDDAEAALASYRLSYSSGSIAQAACS
jgi:hypothetical protein